MLIQSVSSISILELLENFTAGHKWQVVKTIKVLNLKKNPNWKQIGQKEKENKLEGKNRKWTVSIKLLKSHQTLGRQHIILPDTGYEAD